MESMNPQPAPPAPAPLTALGTVVTYTDSKKVPHPALVQRAYQGGTDLGLVYVDAQGNITRVPRSSRGVVPGWTPAS